MIRTTPETAQAEREIADAVSGAWGVKFNRYAYLHSIDWWIEKEGRVVAFAEMKNRDVTTTEYPTVYLALAKWLALTLAGLTGPRPLFIVRYTDGIRWLNVNQIDVRDRLIIGGRTDRPGMPNDIEPIVNVPISYLREL